MHIEGQGIQTYRSIRQRQPRQAQFRVMTLVLGIMQHAHHILPDIDEQKVRECEL